MSSAEITKLAVVYLFNWIIENGYFNKILISNIVHDEILLECDIEISNKLAEVTKYYMELAGNRFFTRVPLKAEPCINNYWSH
jgi:DNA polymerase I-like protein with 3'-5' exonuclease and polymerase domains